jgi:hypothetical protein
MIRSNPLFSSLYWDASRDIDALVSEFLVGFYSAEAAPLILEHMQVKFGPIVALHHRSAMVYTKIISNIR